MTEQLVLPIKLPIESSFDNFVAGDNRQLLTILKNLWGYKEKFFYISGDTACGKTHLLQALCHQALGRNKKNFYLDLANRCHLEPQIFEALEIYDLLCLDNIHHAAGDEQWEEAIFYLYNKVRDLNHYLVVTAQTTAKEIPWKLPDLASRFAWGLSFRLHALTDEGKMAVLQKQATVRGINLSTTVIEYMVYHYSRDLGSLMAMLATLESQSLIQQKRITIPFLRELFCT